MESLEKKVLANPDKVKGLIKKVGGAVSYDSPESKSDNQKIVVGHNKNWDKGWSKYGKP